MLRSVRRRLLLPIRPIPTAALALALGACAGDAPPAQTGRVLTLELPAPSLAGGTRSVLVYVPANYARDTSGTRDPVVYFLHGAPGWNGDWFRQGALAGMLDRLIAEHRIPPLIAVAPDGRGAGRQGRSLWIDGLGRGSRIETYFVHDVVPWVDRTFRTLPYAADRAVVGISDGGDAAVRLVLHHPDVFGACAGLSGRYSPHGPFGLASVVGVPPGSARVLRAESPLVELEHAPDAVRSRFFYVDSGWFDPTALDCLRIDQRLGALGIPHEAHLYPGAHEWLSWRRRLPIALEAIAARFEMPRH